MPESQLKLAGDAVVRVVQPLWTPPGRLVNLRQQIRDAGLRPHNWPPDVCADWWTALWAEKRCRCLQSKQPGWAHPAFRALLRFGAFCRLRLNVLHLSANKFTGLGEMLAEARSRRAPGPCCPWQPDQVMEAPVLEVPCKQLLGLSGAST